MVLTLCQQLLSRLSFSIFFSPRAFTPPRTWPLPYWPIGTRFYLFYRVHIHRYNTALLSSDVRQAIVRRSSCQESLKRHQHGPTTSCRLLVLLIFRFVSSINAPGMQRSRLQTFEPENASDESEERQKHRDYREFEKHRVRLILFDLIKGARALLIFQQFPCCRTSWKKKLNFDR